MTRQETLSEALTSREMETLALLAENQSNAEIANRLNLAISTVKWYTGQIFAKLGVSNRRQAVAKARQLALLQSSSTPESAILPTNDLSSGLPTGMVTFLLTDIQGSTPLWERMPGEMKLALTQHHAILRSAIEGNDGQVYQVIGDAFQAAFRLASSALKAALAAQSALQSAPWGATGPLRVRMGLHTGPAEVDRLGNAPYEVSHTLNRAARVMSAAHGGQILLTQETAGLVDHELPAGASLMDLGEFHLKGLHRLEHLFQASAPHLPQSFPPPAALSTSNNNLPLQTTAFIGREKEIGEVAQLLSRHRLVTLTGSGGTGKTRLSLQAAADTMHRYPNGAWLVELAPLADPEKIAHTIAAVLGLQESGEMAILDMLTGYLKKRHLLLVIDNCEHLIEACARLVDHLLHACPGLVVLASSREALGIAGEVSYRVPSLAIPDPAQLENLEAVQQAEAVSLLIDRAALLAPDFQLTAQNAPAVVEICQRLDGIPLAIELAAARVTMMSIEQIADRLNDRFRLLTGGSRTALPRQQTLRASIDWSYSQLNPLERRLLQRLSVFAGGWTLEAAESVCAQDGMDEYEVIDALTSLVKKSLVAFSPENLPDPRYRLLETIRQYAREKLLDEGGGEALRRRHLAYYLQKTEQVTAASEGPQQRLWLDRLDIELDNLRAALEWGSVDPQVTIFLNGLRLISELARLEIDFDVKERFQWVERYLNQPGSSKTIPNELRAKALQARSFLQFEQSQFQAAHQSALDCLVLAEAIGAVKLQLDTLFSLVYTASWINNMPAAQDYLQRALTLAETAGLYQKNKALILTTKGYYYRDIDQDISKRYYEESVLAYELQGDRMGMIQGLRLLGQLASQAGENERAMAYLQKAVATSRAMKSNGSLRWDLFVCGDHAYSVGAFGEMETFFQEAQQVSEKFGFQRGVVWGLHHVAVAARRQGQRERAIDLTCQALDAAQEYNFTEMVLECLSTLAGLALDMDQVADSARLMGAFIALPGALNVGDIAKKEINRDMPQVRAILGEEAFEEAFREGQSLSLEAAALLGRSAVTI